MSNRPKIGPTGNFPGGIANKHDDGQIIHSLKHVNNLVIWEFGTAVKWMGFTPDEADQLADVLKKHAAAIREEQAAKASKANDETPH